MPSIAKYASNGCFNSSDIEKMTRIYLSACERGPADNWSEKQRVSLSRAIVAAYRADMQDDVILVSALEHMGSTDKS